MWQRVDQNMVRGGFALCLFAAVLSACGPDESPAATVTPAPSTRVVIETPLPATPSPTATPDVIRTPRPPPVHTATPSPAATPSATSTTTQTPSPTPQREKETPPAPGEPRELPAGFTVFYWVAPCYGCGFGVSDVRRVVFDEEAGALREERLLEFFDDHSECVAGFALGQSGREMAATLWPAHCGDPMAVYRGGDLWLSSDGGATWEQWGPLPSDAWVVGVTAEDVAVDEGMSTPRRVRWLISGTELSPSERVQLGGERFLSDELSVGEWAGLPLLFDHETGVAHPIAGLAETGNSYIPLHVVSPGSPPWATAEPAATPAAAPAPTPTPTPTLTPTPTTPVRVASCTSGVAVPNPATNEQLVGECEHLLALRDTLAGTGTLNWSAARDMASWTGVTVEGTPGRVAKLDLANSGLTGELPGLLGRLTSLTELRLDGNALTGRIPSKVVRLTRLTDAYLAGNSLTGCVPPPLRAVANNDMTSLGLGDCDAPTDVSDRTRGDPLPVGTYQYKASSRHVPLVFDIPPGASVALDGLVVTEPQEGTGDSTEGLLLRDEATQSWLCLDLRRAIECNRWVQPGQGPARSGESDLDAIFDRIVESLWLAERSGE